MDTSKPITVRFFYYIQNESNERELSECSEEIFIEEVETGAFIHYERHTIKENGVDQICLVANN